MPMCASATGSGKRKRMKEVSKREIEDARLSRWVSPL